MPPAIPPTWLCRHCGYPLQLGASITDHAACPECGARGPADLIGAAWARARLNPLRVLVDLAGSAIFLMGLALLGVLASRVLAGQQSAVAWLPLLALTAPCAIGAAVGAAVGPWFGSRQLARDFIKPHRQRAARRLLLLLGLAIHAALWAGALFISQILFSL